MLKMHVLISETTEYIISNYIQVLIQKYVCYSIKLNMEILGGSTAVNVHTSLALFDFITT